mmetsp:Transcript_19911/g.62184  ORF Transcript_19911/g.62184 Transcript_19911/m.62184 type:complete len:303 (-) Transcript_19911:53-961(-)
MSLRWLERQGSLPKLLADALSTRKKPTKSTMSRKLVSAAIVVPMTCKPAACTTKTPASCMADSRSETPTEARWRRSSEKRSPSTYFFQFMPSTLMTTQVPMALTSAMTPPMARLTATMHQAARKAFRSMCVSWPLPQSTLGRGSSSMLTVEPCSTPRSDGRWRVGVQHRTQGSTSRKTRGSMSTEMPAASSSGRSTRCRRYVTKSSVTTRSTRWQTAWMCSVFRRSSFRRCDTCMHVMSCSMRAQVCQSPRSHRRACSGSTDQASAASSPWSERFPEQLGELTQRRNSGASSSTPAPAMRAP